MKSGYCVSNYTTQCLDVTSGQTGCFLFDTEHWQKTGELKAISPVYPSLVEFYQAHRDQCKAMHLERIGARSEEA